MYGNGETGRCIVCRGVMTVEEQKASSHSIHVCSPGCDEEFEAL